MKYYDISPIISENFAVFPGDTKFSLSKGLDIKDGHSCSLSSMKSTLHIGSHADAPSHYHINGEDISKRSLSYYLGKCQVLDFSSLKKDVIDIGDLYKLDITSSRILIKTNSWTNVNSWKENFKSISRDAINYLATKKVILIGIDTPSIDISDSKELPSHNSIYKNNMSILECLSLKNILPGEYFLIALPLSIRGGDASPVRAILLSLDSLKEFTKL